MTTRRIGIVGGMGPLAGADFLHLFIQSCMTHLRSRGQEVTDQAFPEHWMVQMPFPDRSAALLGHSEAPLPFMRDALKGLLAQRVNCVAIACNTAHGWHPQLQKHFPEVELLHIVRETVHQLTKDGSKNVCLLASMGMHRLGLYEEALEIAGIQCHIPLGREQADVMQGIYEVKAGNMEAAERMFAAVASDLVNRTGCSTLIMGCTEIPLALRQFKDATAVRLVNPAAALANALVLRAYS